MHELSFREAVIEAIDEQMCKDPSVFMIGENIGKAGGVYQHTKGLFEKFTIGYGSACEPCSKNALYVWWKSKCSFSY